MHLGAVHRDGNLLNAQVSFQSHSVQTKPGSLERLARADGSTLPNPETSVRPKPLQRLVRGALSSQPFFQIGADLGSCSLADRCSGKDVV